MLLLTGRIVQYSIQLRETRLVDFYPGQSGWPTHKRIRRCIATGPPVVQLPIRVQRPAFLNYF